MGEQARAAVGAARPRRRPGPSDRVTASAASYPTRLVARRREPRLHGRPVEAEARELLSAGLDEVPMAYKDIDEVMRAQEDLVEPLARFEPRLVKMAPSGEPPED
jgi:RNA-splicing ligase RtcB